MHRLFGLAVFLSASLLFLVQPMAAQRLLPLAGGSPEVWNTCMLFFQGVLLLGYLYAHGLSRLPPKAQAALHLIVLALAGLALPIALPADTALPSGEQPIGWLLWVLLRMVSLPFFALSAMGPLLQRWFFQSSAGRSRDPYVLYAASNAGSALGLLAYPLVLQRVATLGQQSYVWTIGYVLLVGGALACGWVMVKGGNAPAPLAPEPTIAHSRGEITWARRGRWVLLAFVPSSLMLGVTQHVSTDVAAVPLLWVIPLLLYLLTLSSAFSVSWSVSAGTCGRLLPWLGLSVVALMLSRFNAILPLTVAAHVGFFAVAALMCHRLLADDRPEPARLTEFYLWMSIGGVLGGVCNGLLAPLLTDRLLEYPLLIGVAMLLRPQAKAAGENWLLALGAGALALGSIWASQRFLPESPTTSPTTMLLSLGLVPAAVAALLWIKGGERRVGVAVLALALAALYIPHDGPVLHATRTFFGVHQVVHRAKGWNALMHGSTLHGLQARPDLWMKPGSKDEAAYGAYLQGRPGTYYHPTGPVGDVFRIVQARGRVDAAGLGLGAGAIAAYTRAGGTLTFFEIDPAVARIASDPAYFSFIRDARARARVDIVLGDGRLTLATRPDASYDLIVLDTFTSDAIPVHVMTREAFEHVYLPKLRPHGLIAINTSNRHLNLQPALAAVAESLGLAAAYSFDASQPGTQEGEGKKSSSWVVIAPDARDLPTAQAGMVAQWRPLRGDGRRPWTDDFSDILSVYELNAGGAQ